MFYIDDKDRLNDMEAAQLAPLVLAFIGDTVFDLYVRTHYAAVRGGGAGALHAMSSKVVNARSQAAFAREVEPLLDEREKNVYMRGRNAKSATVPKNMSVADYHHATAIEALIGYLYLTGRSERLGELFARLAL